MKYVNNAFSTKMLQDNVSVEFQQITEKEFLNNIHNPDVHSVIGHEDTAKLFNVAFNRETLQLQSDDILYICELNSTDGVGRLPEGLTQLNELPRGFYFKYWRVSIL